MNHSGKLIKRSQSYFQNWMEREIAVEHQLTSLEILWKVTLHLEKYKGTTSFKLKGIKGRRKKNNYLINLPRTQPSNLILQRPLNREKLVARIAKQIKKKQGITS